MKNLCFDTLYKGGPVFTVIEVNRHYMSIRKQKWNYITEDCLLALNFNVKTGFSVSAVDLKTTA